MWLPCAAALGIALVFLWLNRGAYDGFFQDDELDNISWAPYVGWQQYAVGLLKPLFDKSNFRPVGHAYFTLTSRAFGMDFPPYIAPIFLIHLTNCALLFGLARRLGIDVWRSLLGAALFGLSATAFDAYWKPMYVFDLLCATFCLTSILLFTWRKYVLSFVAFWLAYKSKELAVMLPFVLLAYEYWLGEKRWIPLSPFFVTSLSFGLQGVVLNPNHNNDYTFHFSLNSLGRTIPFYAQRFLFFRYSGLLLLLLLLIRDRRVWFAMAALGCFLFTLLFLPGRLFEAYTYLPFACAALALTAASTRLHCAVMAGAMAVWMFFNVHHLYREQHDKLAQDDLVARYVETLQGWGGKHPSVTTLVYDFPPAGFHNWGVGAAWNLAHHTLSLPSLFVDSPEARTAMQNDAVALMVWDQASHSVRMQLHIPAGR